MSLSVSTLVVGSGHTRLLTKRMLASPRIVGRTAVLRSIMARNDALASGHTVINIVI